MSTTPSASEKRSASARRLRYGLAALAIVVCGAISLTLANLIALDPRLHVAADVTATGDHRLAPRTLQVLESLPPGYEIVICGAATTDRDVRQRIADVLDAMARTGRLTVTWIDDPASPEYAALVNRLIERDQATLSAAADELSDQAAAIERAAALLDSFDEPLKAIEAAIPATGPAAAQDGPRSKVSNFAAIARSLATDARASAETIRGILEGRDGGQTAGGVGVPALDRAVSISRRTLANLATQLQVLAAELTGIAADDRTPREAQLRARALSERVALGRDPVSLASDRAAGMQVPDLVRVARVLEGAQSVLVIGPDGLGAVAFDTLFPASIPETVGGARADVGAAAEDLLASAIASLATPTAPIIVLVHAEDARLVEVGAIRALQARLALRRIEIVEWRIVAEPEPPGLAGLDPTGTRPVVYVSLGTSSAAGASRESGLSGMDRVQRLGAVLGRLAERGEPMLVSVTPSTLPGFGSPDAATSWLAGFGLRIDSGRPLLTERVIGGRRVVDTDRLVSSSSQDDPHPIAGAISGLATGMRWVMPIEFIDPPEGVRLARWPLIEVNAPLTWAEAQWLSFWNIPPDQRALAPSPPTPDPAMGDDLEGPWTIAAAVERTAPGLPAPQRVVVVASIGWFFDALAAQTEAVNGRVAPTLPGNTELFEAAVYWLAGQEGLIARSAASGSVPTVRELSATQATVIRWLVLGVMPLGVLGLGVVWRMWRG